MFTSTFLERLADPSIRNVLICGCGGGFDFVHGLLLVPDLVRLGKTVILGSYSFADPRALTDHAPLVFRAASVEVRRVTAETVSALDYAPEIHVCSFLDARYPEAAPHSVLAYYSRDFTVDTLSGLYARLAEEHDLDAVVLVDGGSDSLVAGDEPGIGDPVEDAVSVRSVASLTGVPVRMLVVIGMGVDRMNGVSDATSLRAVAELTERGAFLGALAVEPRHAAYGFYRDALRHIRERQRSGSVVAGAIVDSVEGRFGSGERPGRVSPESLFVWPLMAVLWAFDVGAVAARSLVGDWIRDAGTPAENHAAVRAGRREVEIRDPDEDRLPETPVAPGEGLYDT